MNQNQKYVLIGVAVVLLLQLVFFTPFVSSYGGNTSYSHGNFFSPSWRQSVDTANFILYWGVIFVFVGIAFYLAKDTKRKRNS